MLRCLFPVIYLPRRKLSRLDSSLNFSDTCIKSHAYTCRDLKVYGRARLSSKLTFKSSREQRGAEGTILACVLAAIAQERNCRCARNHTSDFVKLATPRFEVMFLPWTLDNPRKPSDVLQALASEEGRCKDRGKGLWDSM